MQIIPDCEKCLLEKQTARAETIEDEDKREEYLKKNQGASGA